MPKEFFSVENSTSLATLERGAKIHVIGICGVAMAQISVALSSMGYVISGSDKEYYEPMSSLLKQHPIELFNGFDEENISDDVRLVVIGNSISYGNAEVGVVEKKSLSYTFFPKLLSEVVIRNNHSIVVSGTHGKTTTSALVATVLKNAQKDPSYFIGGIALGLPDSLHVGNGGLSVVEGDEYDSAFFAKVPKFYFYRPETLIITSIEYDHADIYPNLESIVTVFEDLVKAVPSTGAVVCCIDCPQVKRLASAWKNDSQATIITYGVDPSADVKIVSREYGENLQEVTISQQDRQEKLYTPLLGLHNARNVLSVYLASRQAGLSHSEVIDGLKSFSGVRRRQEIRLQHNEIILIEDFAHHPTAVLETLRAIRERYVKNRIIVLFEPRSNSSRRKVFQDSYIEAFESADHIILSQVAARDSDAGLDLIDVKELALKIQAKGKAAQALPTPEAILDATMSIVKSGDVIVVMSNGAFGGIIDKLEKKLKVI